MLRRGNQVPRFTVTTTQGARVSYADLWQHENLLLIALPAGTDAAAYAGQVRDLLADLPADDTAYIVTHDSVPALGAPAALVADRWGEIQFVTEAASVAHLPTPQDLVEWVQHVQHACPECEGEAR